jgi:hypothetical protein
MFKNVYMMFNRNMKYWGFIDRNPNYGWSKPGFYRTSRFVVHEVSLIFSGKSSVEYVK